MTAKLGNEAFTAKAPADVIEKSRARLATAQADIARLESRLAALLSPVGDRGTARAQPPEQPHEWQQ
jgi:hypothetical protein